MVQPRSPRSRLLAILPFLATLTLSSDALAQGADGCAPTWYSARLTTFESYPDPGSDECLKYNGCTWAGQFYGLPDHPMSETWVREHNIVAVHAKDWRWLHMRRLKVRQGTREIFVRVLDLCSDADCAGCCTANLQDQPHLIDMEKYTMQRFGRDDGVVEFQICP